MWRKVRCSHRTWWCQPQNDHYGLCHMWQLLCLRAHLLMLNMSNHPEWNDRHHAGLHGIGHVGGGESRAHCTNIYTTGFPCVSCVFVLCQRYKMWLDLTRWVTAQGFRCVRLQVPNRFFFHGYGWLQEQWLQCFECHDAEREKKSILVMQALMAVLLWCPNIITWWRNELRYRLFFNCHHE